MNEDFNYNELALAIEDLVEQTCKADVEYAITDALKIEFYIHRGRIDKYTIDNKEIIKEIEGKEITDEYFQELVKKYSYEIVCGIAKKIIYEE